MSLDYLAQEIGGPIPPIRGIGGIPVELVGVIMMNIKMPCVQGYDKDQVAIVMDDPNMSECANYQLCKLLFPGFLFTGFLVPSLFGSCLHVFPKGALVVGNSCERFAR